MIEISNIVIDFSNQFDVLQKMLSLVSYSLVRMSIAMLISLIVAFVYGITAAYYKKMEKILIPILDVLQSIPILGFFPIVIFFIVSFLGYTGISIEIAAILLIVTSMVWNMIYSVYESTLTIPKDLTAVSTSIKLTGWKKIKRIIIPSSLPKLVFNMILSWANGWYFLVAAEIISVGNQTYTLPGIGSFLAIATYNGNYSAALIGIITLIILILIIDLLIWRPIEVISERYKFDFGHISENKPRIIYGLTKMKGRIINSEINNQKIRNDIIKFLIYKPVNIFVRIIDIITKIYHKNIQINKIAAIVLFIITGFLISNLFIGKMLNYIPKLVLDFTQLYLDPILYEKVLQIPSAILSSIGRLVIALIISLSWTIFVASRIAKNIKLLKICLPIFQITAAIPASAFFPFIIILLIDIPFGLEVAAILVTVTGMQWYLLFNIIGGIRSIPKHVDEFSDSINLKGRTYWRRILLPSMYPSLVTGSMTAWGGVWNALIIAEFLIFGKYIFSVNGIGALIDESAYLLGNIPLLLLLVLTMIITIIIIDRLIWRKLYIKVEKWSNT